MKRNKRPGKLLPSVLARVLPVTVLVLFGIWFVASKVVTNTVSSELHRLLGKEATQRADAVGLKLRSLIDAAEGLAQNDLVVNALFDVGERENYIAVFFQSMRVPGPVGASVTLADYRGRTIASNTRELSYKGSSWVERTMEGERFVEISANGIIVAVPVQHAGAAEGIVVIEHDRENLIRFLAFVDQGRAIVIKTDDGAFDYAAGDAFTGIDDPVALIEQPGWVTAEATVPGFPNLVLLTAEHETIAFALARRLRNFMLISVLISIGAVTLGIVSTAYMTTKPLNRFIKEIGKVSGASNMNFRILSFGTAEFHSLTYSFNRMLETLESTTTSRDYVDNVLNSINEMLLVTGPQGDIQTANRAALQTLGFSLAELTARNVTSLVSINGDEPDCLTSGNISSLEGIVTTKANLQIPIQISTSALSCGHGNQSNLIFVITNIADRKRAELALACRVRDLARSNEELERFAYVASHDLQEPLRMVSSYTQLLAKRYKGRLDDDADEFIAFAVDGASRMQRLIADLLAYSRVGSRNEAFARTDCAAAFETACRNLTASIEESGATVTRDDLPTLHADPAQLVQLLQNLIGNAVKYRSDEPPEVHVSCEQKNGECFFGVKDNGIGIDPKYADQVFVIFQRLHTREEYAGTGVGLAICKKIVERHGGSIWIESQPGEGTTVWFSIPTKEDESHASD